MVKHNIFEYQEPVKKIILKKVKGYRCECGHFCARPGKLCCRCHTPAKGQFWMPFSLICPICKGTMRNHVDGNYFQRCKCGKVVTTLDRDGTPMMALLANCGDCAFIETKEKVEQFEKSKDNLYGPRVRYFATLLSH